MCMIEFTRGDTHSFTVELRNEAGTVIPFVDGDKVYFTVKTKPSSSTIQLQKIVTSFPLGNAQFLISHADTKDLRFRDYVFDVQVTRADGTVITIIKPATFRMLEEVTHDF